MASLAVALPAQAFSHALTAFRSAAPPERALLLAELARLLAPRGQALVAMALRGSFPEIGDLLPRHALKTSRRGRPSPWRPPHSFAPRRSLRRGARRGGLRLRRRRGAVPRPQVSERADFFEDPIIAPAPAARAQDQPGRKISRSPSPTCATPSTSTGATRQFELTLSLGCATGRLEKKRPEAIRLSGDLL